MMMSKYSVTSRLRMKGQYERCQKTTFAGEAVYCLQQAFYLA